MTRQAMDADRAQAAAYVEQMIPAIPHYIFNSAITVTTPTEITAVLSFGERPLILTIMSPVMAKTLAKSLLARVAEYEELTGGPVKTIAEIAS